MTEGSGDTTNLPSPTDLMDQMVKLQEDMDHAVKEIKEQPPVELVVFIEQEF
jgi:hypothetical protein